MDIAGRLRVLIADDHALLREGLAVLIERQPDMSVVAQAANGHEAVRLAREMQPDIAVLDVSMPELGGAEAAEQIRAACPTTRIVALTRHGDQAYVRRLLAAGAAGYVLKKSAADALLNAIRIVSRGETYVEPTLAIPLLMRGRRGGDRRPPTTSEPALSAREEEVLRAIVWGRSSKEVASQLGLSTKTVESYKATAMEKLGLRSREDLVRYGVACGWLEDEKGPE
jgi:two-component system, NarL family, response regulator NreC